MSDLVDIDRETPREKLTRKQRAERLTSGTRGADHLTDAERTLLAAIRAQGLDIRRGILVNERSGETWQHGRVVVKGARSWSHSIA